MAPITPLSNRQLCLESDRLRYRPISARDIDIATEIFTDPEVIKYVCDLATPEQVAENLPTDCRRGAGGRLGIWIISRKDSGEKIGTAVLLPIPIDQDDTDFSLLVPEKYPDAEIEVGYLLKRDAWGQGFATEACRRMVRFGFENTKLDEIKATADPDNIVSHKVLKKSGLKDQGLRYAYRCQCAGFGITREEWMALS